MAIYDTMRYIKTDVVTICIGKAASMAAILLAGGTKGKRFALPNSKIMIHQPLGGVEGQATDIMIQAEEMRKVKEKTIEILSFHTGQKPEKVAQDIERDYIMSLDKLFSWPTCRRWSWPWPRTSSRSSASAWTNCTTTRPRSPSAAPTPAPRWSSASWDGPPWPSPSATTRTIVPT